MSDRETTERVLRGLVGEWTGTGSGRFPTIDPFRYAERLCFASRAGAPDLLYEQRTTLIADGELSHWETGFLLPQDDGSVHLLNAQQSGRTEVLVGRVKPVDDDVLELCFASVSHAHDPRMVATERVYRIEPGSLSYSMQMSTDRVPTLHGHLEAKLTRAVGAAS